MGSAVKISTRSGRGPVPIRSRRARKPASPIDKAKGYEVVWRQVSDLFDAARRVEAVSFVYFIGEEDDGAVKIGVAKDPVSRLRTMQTGNPRRLRIEHVLIGHSTLEKLLHELWEPFAVKSAAAQRKVGSAPGTEWFRPDVRSELLPIVTTAASAQAVHLRETTGILEAEDIEQMVRDAHVSHGFVAQGRDHVVRLAVGDGLVVSRPSRL